MKGPKNDDAKDVLLTAGAGTSLGGLMTGSRAGAGTGALIGAAAGLAAVLFTRGKDLVLPRGTTVEITLSRPLPLDPVLANFDWAGQPPLTPNRRPRK